MSTAVRALVTTMIAACTLIVWWLASRQSGLAGLSIGLTATGTFLTGLAFGLKRLDQNPWIGLTIIGMLVLLVAVFGLLWSFALTAAHQ